MVTSQIEGYCFWGVLSLLVLFARFLHLTAFLFVPSTRILTIAHIRISTPRMGNQAGKSMANQLKAGLYCGFRGL